MGGTRAQPVIAKPVVQTEKAETTLKLKRLEYYWLNHMWFGQLVFNLPEMREIRKGRDLKLREVLEAVAEHFDTPVFLILSETKRWCIGHPRQVAMFLAMHFTKHSSLKIAQHFNRDHSTVLHGAKKIERKIETDLQVAADVKAIQRKLGLIA